MNENQILTQAKDALDKAVDEARRNRSFLNSVGPAIIEMLRPILENIAIEMQRSREDIKEVISSIIVESPVVNIEPPVVNVEQPKVEVKVNAPEVNIPEIKTDTLQKEILSAIQKGFSKVKMPKPEVSISPSFKIPKAEKQKIEFPSDLEVSLRKDFDNKNPIPVILMDNKGNPYMAVSGGGNAPRIVDINVINPYTSIADGRRTVTTAGTAVRLTSVATNAKTVIITALLANTDVVVIGGSGVIAAAGTRTGIPLLPGQSATLAFSDLTNIWMDSVVSGEGVSFLIMN